LNPTFKPSPPLPTYTRQALWAAHIAEPKGSGAPRALSTRFHIPIERVEAVLRLCALEKEWAKEVSRVEIRVREGRWSGNEAEVPAAAAAAHARMSYNSISLEDTHMVTHTFEHSEHTRRRQ
jgi:hypothetical protein